MKNKFSILLIILVLIIAIMPFSLAQVESFGNFKINQKVDLIQTYNATYCNITSITSPNATIYAENVIMTKSGVKFNYTFTSTSELGDYTVCGECDTTPWCAKLNIGTSISTAQAILYFVFLLAAFGLFFLCLYYAVKIPWKHQRNEDGEVIGINDLRYVKLFLIVMSYFILMFVSGLLRSITANFIPELGVSGFFEWIFWIMLSLMYPIIVCSLILGLIIFINNKKLQKAIQRGLPIQ